MSTGDGPWRWVGGVFFNTYDSSGTSFELAPGLTEFSGIAPILGGRPVSEPVEYYSLGSQAVEELALFGEISRVREWTLKSCRVRLEFPIFSLHPGLRPRGVAPDVWPTLSRAWLALERGLPRVLRVTERSTLTPGL